MRNIGALNISPSILNGKVKKKRSIRITIQKSAIVIKAISIFLPPVVCFVMWDILHCLQHLRRYHTLIYLYTIKSNIPYKINYTIYITMRNDYSLNFTIIHCYKYKLYYIISITELKTPISLILTVLPQRGQLMKTIDEIELSLRKKFHKKIFSKFAKALNEYEMLKEGDKVAVCISGGKDSFLLAKCFQEIKRHNKFPFEVVFLAMDPGYTEANRKKIEENAELLGIPIQIFDSEIFGAVYTIEQSPCYLCARMRRGHLYAKAKELGCNKIALGHHYDDVIETTLMGMLYGSQIQTMMPKLHSTNFEGMELIRPLYLVREEDIIHWRDYNELTFLNCACKFTEVCTGVKSQSEFSLNTTIGDIADTSKRAEVKNLIKAMKVINPYVDSNIFKSTENVNIDTLVAYKKNGEYHSFLDEYDEKG